MTAEPTPDLSLESERARIFAEAKVIAERLAHHTKLINEWARQERDGHAG